LDKERQRHKGRKKDGYKSEERNSDASVKKERHVREGKRAVGEENIERKWWRQKKKVRKKEKSKAQRQRERKRKKERQRDRKRERGRGGMYWLNGE
jgi:hypothetical protein